VSVGELTKTLNLSTKVIRNYLDNLRIDEFIEREGSKKTGNWIVKEIENVEEKANKGQIKRQIKGQINLVNG
jgi:predicted HTH transcriptional regulator